MNLAQAGAIIEAVRSHPDIGTGSCSYIDETMSTLEILEEVKDAKATTMKNGKPATQGVCPKCNTKVFRIGKGQ